jgi:hypothetical protein
MRVKTSLLPTPTLGAEAHMNSYTSLGTLHVHRIVKLPRGAFVPPRGASTVAAAADVARRAAAKLTAHGDRTFGRRAQRIPPRET